MFELIAANPLFLWMLPLAGVPVLFHLFFKVRKRTRPFSTLMFFQRADPRLSARKKIREWLALLLRILAILFLLLSLARLVWLGAGHGGTLAAVFVIDNSASMSAEHASGRSKLDYALDAAHAMVTDLDEADMGAIVLLVDDPAAALPDGLVSDKQVLGAAIDHVAATEAGGSPAAALARAAAVLKTASASRSEVHVFTDLQEGEWGKGLSTVPGLSSSAAILVHHIDQAASKQANVSVAGVELPSRRMLAGRSGLVKVKLVNPTSIDATVRLNALSDAEARTTRSVSIPARESRAVLVPFEPATPGFHFLDLWVEDDAFGGDNRAFVGLVCKEREHVSLLGGADDFGLLPVALMPAGDGTLSGLAVRSGEMTPPGGDADRPIMVVTTWSGVSGRDTLRSFVEGGGILLVLPSASPRAVPSGVPDWIGAAPRPIETREEGVPLIVFSDEARLWDDLKDDTGKVALRNVKAFRFSPLEVSGEATPLMGLEDGRVLLCQRALGKGMVFACGVAFDPAWSTLPLKGSSLALVQGMALLKPPQTAEVSALTAGQRFTATAGLGEQVTLESIAGSPLEWQGPAAGMPALPRSGVYAARSGDAAVYLVVRSAPAEGRAQFLSGPRVPVLGGLSHRVLRFEGVSALLKKVRKARTGTDLLLPFLLLALAAVLLEGWVVNPAPRGRTPGAVPGVGAGRGADTKQRNAVNASAQ